MTVEVWTDQLDDQVHVRVTLDDGSEHHRALNPRDESAYRALRRASHYWEHGQRVAAMPLDEHFTEERRRAAAMVDRCLAVEQLFPHLRELLPA